MHSYLIDKKKNGTILIKICKFEQGLFFIGWDVY